MRNEDIDSQTLQTRFGGCVHSSRMLSQGDMKKDLPETFRLWKDIIKLRIRQYSISKALKFREYIKRKEALYFHFVLSLNDQRSRKLGVKSEFRLCKNIFQFIS